MVSVQVSKCPMNLNVSILEAPSDAASYPSITRNSAFGFHKMCEFLEYLRAYWRLDKGFSLRSRLVNVTLHKTARNDCLKF